MAEVVISTESINSYGTRIVTAGIDIEQYRKNPVLLFMHRRASSWRDDDAMPIGTMENLRVEDGKLIGTPVFDQDDEFARKVERKWNKKVLRMASPGIEPIEFSTAPEHIQQGQSRATITKSKLIEVSIVDIGSNDDALQLYHSDGRVLELAKGADSTLLPLLKPSAEGAGDDAGQAADTNTNKITFQMKNIFLKLGLPETATEEQAVAAIAGLQEKAGRAETIELARITGAVERAVTDRRITADKKEHFISLGKTSGFEALEQTLNLMAPALKPSDLIVPGAGGASTAALEFSKLTPEQLRHLRENDQAAYIQLYKKEFGFEPDFAKHTRQSE